MAKEHTAVIYAEAHGDHWRVMLEDTFQQSIGHMHRPKQPVNRVQEYPRCQEDAGPAKFGTFEEADAYARGLDGCECVVGVWQFFPNVKYVSNR